MQIGDTDIQYYLKKRQLQQQGTQVNKLKKSLGKVIIRIENNQSDIKMQDVLRHSRSMGNSNIPWRGHSKNNSIRYLIYDLLLLEQAQQRYFSDLLIEDLHEASNLHKVFQRKSTTQNFFGAHTAQLGVPQLQVKKARRRSRRVSTIWLGGNVGKNKVLVFISKSTPHTNNIYQI